MPHPVVLYDGVCGLCNRFVRFVLRYDRGSIFYFASLQSPLGTAMLSRHGVSARDLNTLYVVVSSDSYPQSGAPTEILLCRSQAVLFVMERLGTFWHVLAFLLRLMPNSLLDFVYNIIARHRYAIFGRSEACVVPGIEIRARFLDL